MYNIRMCIFETVGIFRNGQNGRNAKMVFDRGRENLVQGDQKQGIQPAKIQCNAMVLG